MSSHWCEVTVILLAALRQVITSRSVGCYPEQCNDDEFCCDGLCCSYFGSNWYAWLVMVLLLFTIVTTCLFFPRFSWRQKSHVPIQYHLFTSGTSDVPSTKLYKQQPQIPIHHSPACDKWPQQYHPYRYEQLVQQMSSEIEYPEPSAPPKSP